jgi:hypothetical protein
MARICVGTVSTPVGFQNSDVAVMSMNEMVNAKDHPRGSPAP